MLLISKKYRIDTISALILITLTLAAGISVYIVMQQQAESVLSNSLATTLRSNVRLFESQIDHVLNNTQTVATRPYLIQTLKSLNAKPGSATALSALQASAQSFALTGFTGISFYDTQGHEVAHAGQFSRQHELQVSLKPDKHSALLWNGEFILRASSDILDQQGQRVGTITTEAPLPQMTHAFADIASIGKTGEFAICAPSANDDNYMDCFLNRISGKDFKHLARVVEGKPLPMSYALKGQNGIIFAKDYRREKVVAAYTAVNTSSLGMVIKLDQTELYHPVIAQLKFVVPLLAILVLAGILLLHFLVKPLLQKLVDSERETRDTNTLLHDSEKRIRAIVDNIDEGIVTINEDGFIESFNPAAERIFGYSGDEIKGQNIRQLLPEKYREKHDSILEHYLKTRDQKFIGTGRQALGLRKNGDNFHMELKTSEAQLESGNLFIISVRDISERKLAEQRILHLANHDALTNLPNRNLLRDRIQQALIYAQRNSAQGALLFIDLDKFKIINDTLGHDVGDLLLKEVAHRLTSSLRNQDTVARYGGDEFIVLLHSVANVQDAGNVANKLLHALLMPYHIKGNELHISASIGIAIFPDDGKDADTLLTHSDSAMYYAKEAGRNNYKFFMQQMNPEPLQK